MSVQRYSMEAPTGVVAVMAPYKYGNYVRYADHVHIVQEMEQANYEQGFRDGMASARAAVVAEAESGFYTDVDDALTAIDEATANGVLRYESDERKAAAPRTLTAADPEPAVTSVGLDRDQSVWQRVGSTEHSRWVNPFMGTREWSDVLARGPVRLLHDGEATPQVKPCSTCGEPVAYLTARPGWAGGWLHHPARPLDGHPAAIDGEAGR